METPKNVSKWPKSVQNNPLCIGDSLGIHFVLKFGILVLKVAIETHSYSICRLVLSLGSISKENSSSLPRPSLRVSLILWRSSLPTRVSSAQVCKVWSSSVVLLGKVDLTECHWSAKELIVAALPDLAKPIESLLFLLWGREGSAVSSATCLFKKKF